MMKVSPGKLWGLRRLADEGGRFKMLAMDQTGPIVNPIKEVRGLEKAPFEDVAAVKLLLARHLTKDVSAVLVDPPLGYAPAIAEVPARKGLILATEWATWEVTATGRKSCNIPGWDAGVIRTIGADAVKVNLWFRPDVSPDVKVNQLAYVNSVKRACARADIPFVLEFLIYPFPGEDADEFAGRRTQLVLGGLSDPDIMDPEGVDVYKLEAPIQMAHVPDPEGPGAAKVQAVFDRMASGIRRPWVQLSGGAGPDDFLRILTYSYRAGASGYLAGRAIWAEAFRKFPDLKAMEQDLRTKAAAVVERANELTDRMATPWPSHGSWSGKVEMEPDGPGFASAYAQSLRGHDSPRL